MNNRDCGWKAGIQTSTSFNSITMSNILDAAGQAVKTFRLGTDNSQFTLSQSVFDVAGRQTSQTNALNGAATTSYFYDSQGQLIKTNTFPDGGTRIETHYMDIRGI